MAYIRHRPRIIRESVYEDLKKVLIDLDWIDPTGGEDYMGMLGDDPIILTDYFPVEAVYQGEEVEINTLAIDQGTQSEPERTELGGDNREQMHLFNLAFFAKNDGIALSLFSDLTDRYKGVNPAYGEYVNLYDYINEADPDEPFHDVSVLTFEVAKSPEQPAPGRLLWFAQLIVLDYLDFEETGSN